MNQDPNNPYRQLEHCTDWSVLHDATTQYVKNINTVFVRGVHNITLDIVKVPFSMRKVTTGSLNHENLSDEIILAICNVKKVENNAWKTIVGKINDARRSSVLTPALAAMREYKSMHDELQVTQYSTFLLMIM